MNVFFEINRVDNVGKFPMYASVQPDIKIYSVTVLFVGAVTRRLRVDSSREWKLKLSNKPFDQRSIRVSRYYYKFRL